MFWHIYTCKTIIEIKVMKRIFFLYFLSKWTQIYKILLKQYVYVWVCVYLCEFNCFEFWQIYLLKTQM